MRKFLDLVRENTPGEEQESLADKFHRFAERVSALEEGRDINVDELLLELNGLNEELTTLGGVPEAEDSEIDLKDLKNVDTALATANTLKSASDPQRPSRGVKQIDKSVSKLGKAVAKTIDKVSNSLR